VVEAGTIWRYTALARQVLAGAPRLGRVRFVAVDGPAGSGKTTFAGRLSRALRASGATVAELHVDDLLEGWSGLETFWPRWVAQIAEPLRGGEPAHYQRYDWIREQFDERWVTVAVPDVLMLEGVSSARTATDPHRGLGVYVTVDRALRLARGVARDGEGLRPRWLSWMTAEDRHFAAEGTASRVDVIVDGSPTVPHDAESEYVGWPART
jgi:hypothetical protein